MKYESIFHRVATQAGVETNAQLKTAKSWFALGVAAAEGEMQQKPALLAPLTTAPVPEDKLTQSEIMSLRSAIAEVITLLHDENTGLKHVARDLYDICDKENPNTEEAFISLNQVRSGLRRNKFDIKRLSGIQRKLKKMA